MNQDIFGASSMGYALIESNRLERWQAFLEDGIGLHLQHADRDCLAFRMDSHQRRIIVKRGPAEDFAAIGWQLRDQATLDIVLQRLQARGIAVQASSAAEAVERGVTRFWRVNGPKRLAVELFVEPLTTNEALDMLCAGFITGEAGMGHLAITSRRAKDMRRFWEEIFDARQSDSIVEQLAGVTLDIEFFRVNPRHHSIAIAQVRDLPIDPIRTKAQHMNLLVTSVAGSPPPSCVAASWASRWPTRSANTRTTGSSRSTSSARRGSRSSSAGMPWRWMKAPGNPPPTRASACGGTNRRSSAPGTSSKPIWAISVVACVRC